MLWAVGRSRRAASPIRPLLYELVPNYVLQSGDIFKVFSEKTHTEQRKHRLACALLPQKLINSDLVETSGSQIRPILSKRVPQFCARSNYMLLPQTLNS